MTTLEVIRQCVSELPHEVRWYEPEELTKHHAGQPAKEIVERHRLFHVPASIALDLPGGGADDLRAIAEEFNCTLHNAPGGGFLFVSNAK